MIGREEDQPVATVARFRAVAARKRENFLKGETCFCATVKILGRQANQTQGGIIRDVGVRREDVDAFKERGANSKFPKRVCQFGANIVGIVEPAFTVFHFPAEIGAGIEPESCRFLRLVASRVQVMEAVGEPVKRVGIGGGNLSGLETSKQDAGAFLTACAGGTGGHGRWGGAKKDGSGYAPGGLDGAETRLFGF